MDGPCIISLVRSLVPAGSGYHSSVMSEVETKHSCFAMFYPLDATRYLCYLENKTLQPRDFAVLFAMMSFCDTKTARIKFSVSYLAGKIGTSPPNVSTSISRLKKALLVARLKDSRGLDFYMINPYLFSVGSRQRWGFHLKEFMSAFNQEDGEKIVSVASIQDLGDSDTST